MRPAAILMPFVGALAACHGGAPPRNPASILPLRTLRLYETGVGYFERTGAVTANDTALPLPAGHIDDALKTLVVLAADGSATVQGVEFPSTVSRAMARSLAGLPLNADGPISFEDLLASLRGASVEIATPSGTVAGRLVDVVGVDGAAPLADDDKGEKGAPAKGQEKRPAPRPAELTLLVLTDRGEIRRVPAAALTTVRPRDPAVAARLRAALDALSTRGAQARRLLRVLSQSARPVTIGYVAETPIWRTTYRLVLDDAGRPGRLVGWALLHNDTDEDWRGVKIQLVSGQPDSFLFPLASPRYARRQLVPPRTELSTVPQLLGTTVDALWGDHVNGDEARGGLVGSATGEGYGVGGLGLVGSGRGGGGSGGGSSGDAESSLLAVGSLAGIARATGLEAGALFAYALPTPLELRAHASALLPFVDGAIDVRPITWVGEPGATARSAVRLTNSTSQTLPAGPVALFADGGFAGESALDRLKPGERRFIQFGADLDLELRLEHRRATEEPRRFALVGTELEEHYLKRTDLDYVLENRGGRARAVFLALRLVDNAKVTGPDAMDYDLTSSQPAAVFQVPGRTKVERAVHTEEGLVRRTAIAGLTATRLAEAAAHPALPAAQRAALADAAARQRELEAGRQAREKARQALGELERDIARLREHLKAAGGDKGPGAAAGPLVARVLGAEDRLTALRRSLEALEADVARREQAVRAALRALAPAGPASQPARAR
jgi:hypothetical protein